MKNASKMAKLVLFAALFVAVQSPRALFAFGGGENVEKTTLTLAAAASLKNAFDGKLIPQFQAKYPNVAIDGTYASSGNLQTQIENGLVADVFFSAALTQMNALATKGFVNDADVVKLLQNKLVLIKKKGSTTTVADFAGVARAKTVAIGDPKSVPAGQYAQEAFTKLGNWAAVNAAGKASLGADVTQVLGWVAAGSAEVGVVYATDAASNADVEVIAVLQDGVLAAPVIYPVAVTAKSAHTAQAKLFVDYLASPEGIAVFKEYGFAQN
ncbi:MAG: molybdate ABC transporter substrate-binding protein [Spirochaetaceae bacterium]|jgi:molybdate transport system substrate-binding protein|nr:molybdate ABC transporter substrate-binding protein [Spirochaetaceae bacterium]